MSSPASVNAGGFVTFTMVISNGGPGDAANITLVDTIPGTFQSSTTTQGVCVRTGSVLSCTLGAMPAGGSATIKLTVAAGTTALANTASIQLRDALGNISNTDPNLTNNSASSTTAVNVIAPPPVIGGVGGGGGGGATSADIQVKGSAQNGGPNAGQADTFTWQIKNATGNTTVSNVTFTLPLPSTFQFGAASASQGSCSGPPTGTFGGTITCTSASLGGGQTLTVSVNFTPTQAGTFSTTGSATFNGTDTQTGNNAFTVTIRPR
jgi:uncharacterized repeat protein (TIGR01451 family)